MANKTYLDKTGLTYFWGKIKTALNGKANTGDIPTKTSDLNNDSGYITIKSSEIIQAKDFVGKNLCDGKTTSGRWTFTVGSTISPTTQAGVRSVNSIDVNSSTQYTLSATFNTGSVFIVETDASNNVLAIDGNNGYMQFNYTANTRSSMTITTHSSAKHLYWYSSSSATTPPTDFMVELGNTMTTYEEYIGKLSSKISSIPYANQNTIGGIRIYKDANNNLYIYTNDN